MPHISSTRWIFLTIVLALGGPSLVSPNTPWKESTQRIEGFSDLYPSDRYQSCYFNNLCYCKYSQQAELYALLQRTWHHTSFNQTHFLRLIQTELKAIGLWMRGGEQGGGQQQQVKIEHGNGENSVFARNTFDINSIVSSIVNRTRVSFDPGPLFEFFCAGVPIASLPTDYATHGILSHVSVEGSQLFLLDGSSFAGVEVQNMQLTRNELYFISDYAFSSMSNSLTVLDLSANLLDEVPFGAFKALKILEWLNLSNNRIHGLEGDWFGLIKSLRQLTLSSNSIQVLPSKVFPAFSRLIWLDLSSNFIRNLSQHNLPPNLQTLILMRNPIVEFPLGIFSLRSLSWLVLSGCAIEIIPTEWPRGTPPTQINQLVLSENFIQHWPGRPFAMQLKVLDVDLSRNYMSSVPAGAFHSMSTFRLSLGHNRILRIDPLTFDTLEPTLQYLNLDNNRLDSLPWEALLNLTSLRHFYVGNNFVRDQSLENKAMPSDYDCRLTHVGLNGNGLTKLPSAILSRCRNTLLHLNLGYNQIHSLDQLVTKKFRNLSTLILRNNPIHSLAYEGSAAANTMSESVGSGGGGDNGIHPTLIPSASILSPDAAATSSASFMSVGEKVPNVFRLESFPHLYELSLSFCELSGELPRFPQLDLTNLEMSGGLKSATRISADAFQALRKLEWIAIDHNQINSLSDHTFYGNNNVSYVNLAFNRISHLPRQLFHPDIHSSIRELRLSHNRISVISSDTFHSFPGLILDLSYNLIHTVERGAFTISPQQKQKAATPLLSPTSKKPSLLHLDSAVPGLSLYLTHNRINTCKEGAFSQEKFALVHLAFNQLSHFSFDAFGKNTLIGGVNISHNSLESVNGGGGRNVLIKYLDLSHNKLSTEAVTLRSICPEQLLDLSYNRIERVVEDMLPYNCSLKELRLDKNHITRVDSTTFQHQREMTVLHLRGNVISSVPEITFIRNQRLTELDLSQNRIRSLPRDSLVGSNIEILNLSSNQFVNLPVGALSQISRRLKVLEMSNNALEHLDSTMFESIPGLVHLNLSSNRLTTLPDNAFAYLGSLRELDLSGNYIRANFKELFHFLPKLKLLRLSNCGLTKMPFLPLPHLLSLDMSGNGMSEIGYQSLTSLGRLRDLDLSNNLLTNGRLPGTWGPLQNLVGLKLSKNQLKSLTRDTFSGLSRLESLELLDLDRVERFDSDVLSYLLNLKKLSVQTYPNIEKYRFRLGAVLSGTEGLEELTILIKEASLSDQLFGGISPKLRRLSLSGQNLKRIEDSAFEGLQNCHYVDLAISHTSVDELPPRLFELLQNSQAKLDLSWNKISSLNSASLYPNSSLWYSKGTKLLQGGLVLEGNEWTCDCNLVWIGDWMRRWLRESFESHSVSVSEVHSMYEALSRPTCHDPRTTTHIPLIQLYPDNMCHASALSKSGHSTLLHPPAFVFTLHLNSNYESHFHLNLFISLSLILPVVRYLLYV